MKKEYAFADHTHPAATGGGGLVAHALVGGYHSASGLTTGQYLRATSPTTFGFAAIAQADVVGLKQTDTPTFDGLNVAHDIDVGGVAWLGVTAVQSTLDVYSYLYHRSHFKTLDFAGTGWMTWVTRYNSGSAIYLNLSNLGTIQAASRVEIGVTGLGARRLNVYAPTYAPVSTNEPLTSFNGEIANQAYGTYLYGFTAIRTGTVGATCSYHNVQLETQDNSSAVLTELNSVLCVFARALLQNTGGAGSHPDLYGYHQIVEIGATNTSQPRDVIAYDGSVYIDQNVTTTGGLRAVMARIYPTGAFTITGDAVCVDAEGWDAATHGLRIRDVATADGTYGIYCEAGDHADNYAFLFKKANAGATLSYLLGDGTFYVSAGGTFANLTVSQDTPFLRLCHAAGDADEKWWDIIADDHILDFRAVNDAYGAANSWVTVTRSGATISNVTFPAAVIASSSVDVGAIFYQRDNSAILNKAGSGWVTWLTRNTAGAETVCDLTNIGALTAGGSVTLNSLTASLPVVTDGSKVLASLAYADFKTNLALTQNDITNLTTTSGPTFDHLHITADVAAATVTASGNVSAQRFNNSFPNQTYNAFSYAKIYDAVNTNILAGKWPWIHMTVDGVESAPVTQAMFDLNYEHTSTIHGDPSGPDVVIVVDVVTDGLYGANGITYASGKVYLCFYYNWVPEGGITGRVKDKDGVWTAFSSIAAVAGNTSVYSGTIPINNWLTQLEFTIKAGATDRGGGVNWGLTQIEYHGTRIAQSQSAQVCSVGGTIGGYLTIGSLTASLPVVTNSGKTLASVSYATFKTSLAIAQADVSGLTTASSPTWVGATFSGLTASVPVVTGASKELASVSYATFKASLAIAQADVSGLTTASSPIFAGVTLGNTGLHLLDTNDSHDLILKPGSDLSADKTLTLTTGDADRTLTLNGNATLNDWFDQNVKTTGTPQFTRIGIGTAADGSIPVNLSVDLATWTLYCVNVNSGSYGMLLKAGNGTQNILHLQDYGGNNRFYVQGNGVIYMPTIGTGAGNYPMKWGTGGVITYDTSDERLKENARPLKYGLKEILTLRPKRYFHHDAQEDRILETGRETFGLIAQDVEGVMPDVVIRPSEGAVWYGIEYDRIISVLVNAVRELAALQGIKNKDDIKRLGLDSILSAV